MKFSPEIVDTLKCFGNTVIVRPMPEPGFSAGGLHIPDAAREAPQRGIVILIGPGNWNDRAERRIPIDQPEDGDMVFYSKYQGKIVPGTNLLALDVDELQVGVYAARLPDVVDHWETTGDSEQWHLVGEGCEICTPRERNFEELAHDIPTLGPSALATDVTDEPEPPPAPVGETLAEMRDRMRQERLAREGV